MTIDTFEQGEDIYRSITLKIEGVATDTANFLTIEVDVYHKRGLNKIGEYSLVAGTITKEAPATNGVISFIVSRTENATAKIGIYAYEVLTTETDTDYESNIRKRKFKDDCFNLESSNE